MASYIRSVSLSNTKWHGFAPALLYEASRVVVVCCDNVDSARSRAAYETRPGNSSPLDPFGQAKSDPDRHAAPDRRERLGASHGRCHSASSTILESHGHWRAHARRIGCDSLFALRSLTCWLSTLRS